MCKTRSTWRRGIKVISRVLIFILIVYIAPVGYQAAIYYVGENRTSSWWDLRSDSSDQAPDASMTDDAVIQVYAARTVRWRGVVGVHTWVATKRQKDDYYVRYEVMGYALRWGRQAVQIRPGQPDRYWYGSKPQLLRQIRGGEKVEALIDKLQRAAENYIYDQQYTVWPGPNSNTFVAHLGRQVHQLNLELPATAVGKDYLPNGKMAALTPSGKGLQLSFRGLLGFVIGIEEGVELNIAGLTAGIDFSPFAIKLPGVGRIGLSDTEKIELR